MGHTPLALAAWKGHVDAIRALTELGGDLEAKDRVRLAIAAARRAHAAPDSACAQNAGRTPLANAAYNGHVDAIRAMVELGADLEAKTNVCARVYRAHSLVSVQY